MFKHAAKVVDDYAAESVRLADNQIILVIKPTPGAPQVLTTTSSREVYMRPREREVTKKGQMTKEEYLEVTQAGKPTQEIVLGESEQE
jgi:hypothetical protein